MGCQTGFYLTVINHDDYDEIVQLVENVLNDVVNAEEVPACNELQCGWAASHDLEGAKKLAEEMLAKKDEWKEVF